MLTKHFKLRQPSIEKFLIIKSGIIAVLNWCSEVLLKVIYSLFNVWCFFNVKRSKDEFIHTLGLKSLPYPVQSIVSA